MRIVLLILFTWPTFGLTLRSPSSNVSATVDWQPKARIQLDIADVSETHAARIELELDELQVMTMAPHEKHLTDFKRPFESRMVLPDEATTLQLLIKFRHDRWLIFVGNDRVLRMPAPFPAHSLTASGPVSADSMRAQKIARLRFDDDFIQAEPGKPLTNWDVQSGSWQLRTVQEDALEQKSFDKPGKEFVEATHSPNFFSLLGQSRDGSPAVISTGYPFADDYGLRASVQTQPGEMGLVFYQQERSYYAFTLSMPADPAQPTILKLWRRGFGRIPNVDVLGAVSVDLAPDQWVSLKVRAADGQIRCMLDNTTVITVREDLPPNGRFGLYLRSPHSVRFDDVHMATVPDLPLGSLRSIAFHSCAGEPDLYRRICKAAEHGGDLILPAAPAAQWLVFGGKGQTPEMITADYEARVSRYNLGLICGYHADNRAHYRFRVEGHDDKEVFVLERVLGSIVRGTERWSRPRHPKRSSRVRLRVAVEDGHLRCYRDDELVILHRLRSPLAGAAGIFSGPGHQTRVRHIDYRLEAPAPLRDQREKNTVFQSDPFMRHWSSPEGNWYTDSDKQTWHKSDFFGRFRLHMPWEEDSEVHIGIRDGKASGAYILRCSDSHLALFDGNETAIASIARSDDDDQWDLHADGFYLTLAIGDRQHIQRIPTPLRGTRIRIDGFRSKALHDSWVDRYQVKDYLFTEAPHEWVINGGKWQIINRFQCDPRFSHLNGENGRDRAAMWTKYDFSGDFCIELYAGIRHGDWYDRCGDINMTMMNRLHTPSRGYTVTCTEWDPDHSQQWSTFFREGVALDRSDAYTVPRFRAGNKRKVTDPLINSGRDVHGAWYYLKLRRIGNHLTYSFDNEEVFSLHDDKPLQDGPFGLWTFLNSLVVARVKIAAQDISPRQIRFRRLKPDALPRYRAQSAADEPPVSGDTFAVATRGAKAWHADDPVSQPVLTWREETGKPPAFTMRNRLGGGAFFAKSALPFLRSSQLAGFRFELKRDDAARFNFHYRAYRGEKLYERAYLQLCGTDYDRGKYRMRGEAAIPASKQYTQIDAWLPGDLLALKDGFIEVDGFGNRQPGAALAGLGGNGIDTTYSVRGFTPILMEAPELTTEAFGVTHVRSLLLLDAENGDLRFRAANLNLANRWLREHASPGLNDLVCRAIDSTHEVVTRRAVWLELPASPDLSIGWSETPGQLLLRTPHPDPRVPQMQFQLGKIAVSATQVGTSSWEIPLPRDPAISEELQLQSHFGDNVVLHDIPWRSGRRPDAPQLLSVEGLPLFENFERDAKSFSLRPEAAKGKVISVDGERVFELYNTAYKQRLRSNIAISESLARYPLFSFRYRAEDMARISMWPRAGSYARMSEKYGTEIRGGGLELDKHWHRWLGRISDAMGEEPLAPATFAPGVIYFGSRHEHDQTGRHTRLWMDDFVLGPALSEARGLSISPSYFDLDGVYAVYWALQTEGVADESLSWTRSENGAAIEPDIAVLPEGMATLLLRASDYHNRLSVTTRIPLLVDRQAPVVAHERIASDSPDGNGSELRIRFAAGDGAPLDMEPLELRIGDEVLERDERLRERVQVTHRPDEDELRIDWAYLFRKQLNKLGNGDSVTLGLANIVDGAGNRQQDQEIRISIDHEADELGPTWLPMDMSAAVRWRPNWYGPGAGRDVGGGGNSKLKLVRELGAEPYLQQSASGSKSSIRRDVEDWVVEEHPFVSFWVRLPELPTDEHEIRVSCDAKEDGMLAIWPGKTHVPWEENVWHPVTIDMRKHGAKGKATWLDVTRTRLKKRVDMDVAGLLVHRPWQPDDRVHLDGYDVSGLARVEWELIDAAGNIERQGRAKVAPLSPAGLGLQAGAGKWLYIYLVDKADNRSLPLRLPMPN